MADNALNAQKMNVRPGGKQPVMHDTTYLDKDGASQPQQMYSFKEGKKVPKGLKMVLEERGTDTKGLIQEKMVELLSKEPDFDAEKTMVEKTLLDRGHMVNLLPSFTVNSSQ